MRGRHVEQLLHVECYLSVIFLYQQQPSNEHSQTHRSGFRWPCKLMHCKSFGSRPHSNHNKCGPPRSINTDCWKLFTCSSLDRLSLKPQHCYSNLQLCQHRVTWRLNFALSYSVMTSYFTSKQVHLCVLYFHILPSYYQLKRNTYHQIIIYVLYYYICITSFYLHMYISGSSNVYNSKSKNATSYQLLATEPISLQNSVYSIDLGSDISQSVFC